MTVSRSQPRPAMPRVARASVVVGLAAATAAVLAGVAYADDGNGQEDDPSVTYAHGRSGQNGHTEVFCPGGIGTAVTGHQCEKRPAPSGAATDWTASHQEGSFCGSARGSGRGPRPGDGARRTGHGLHGLRGMHNINRAPNGADGHDGSDETGGADGADGVDRYYYHGP